MKNGQTFKIFIVEDDAWYGSMLQHYLSLNPEYEVKRFESPTIFLPVAHNPECSYAGLFAARLPRRRSFKKDKR